MLGLVNRLLMQFQYVGTFTTNQIDRGASGESWSLSHSFDVNDHMTCGCILWSTSTWCFRFPILHCSPCAASAAASKALTLGVPRPVAGSPAALFANHIYGTDLPPRSTRFVNTTTVLYSSCDTLCWQGIHWQAGVCSPVWV